MPASYSSSNAPGMRYLWRIASGVLCRGSLVWSGSAYEARNNPDEIERAYLGHAVTDPIQSNGALGSTKLPRGY